MKALFVMPICGDILCTRWSFETSSEPAEHMPSASRVASQLTAISDRAALVLFFGLAYSVSWLFWLPLVASEREWIRPLSPPIFYNLAGLGPMIAALVVTWRVRGEEGLRNLASRLVRLRVGLKWYAAALGLFPVVFGAGVLITVVSTHSGAPAIPNHRTWHQPILAVFFIMPVFVLFEEIGWRGCALSLLQKKCNALAASLVLGLLWVCWHLPSFWMPHSPHEGVPFLGFTELTLLWSVIATWIYNNTQSVALVWLLHLSGNFTLIFFPRPPNAGTLMSLVTLLLLMVCIAIVLLGRKYRFTTERLAI